MVNIISELLNNESRKVVILQSLSSVRPTPTAMPARAGTQTSVSEPQDSLSLSQPPAQQPPAQQPPVQTEPTPPQQPTPPPQPQLKDWTILIYSVSDNNLYPYMQSDLDEAERVGSTDEMNVVAETSHQPRGGNVVRLKLETDSTPGVKSPVLQDLGRSHDMAKSENLADSIAWAMKEYPSKHFFLICSDHGAGWKGAHHSESTDSWMNASDLEAGLKSAQEKTGRKIDVLGFDECLMASTEIAHQLKDYADYMVASEEVEGGAGWQYDEALGKNKPNSNSRILSGKVLNYAAAALRARDPLTPPDMAKAIVQMAEGHQRDLGTMSAIDMNKMGALTTAIDEFAGKVLDSNLVPKDFAPVVQQTQKFYDFADMGHFVQLAGARFGGEIGAAAEGVKAALEEAVIAEQHSQKYPNAKGLNIELRRQAAGFAPDSSPIPNLDADDQSRMSMAPYSATKWAQDTRWDEMLRKIR